MPLEPASDDDLRHAASAILSPPMVRSSDGIPLISYVKRKSFEEITARAAIASLLRRNKLNPIDIQMLADLIDPWTDKKFMPQEFVLGFRSPGNRPQVMKDLWIHADVDDLRQEGQSFEVATATVGERYGLTEDAVRKVYGRIKRKLATQQAERKKTRI